ncbi:MAG TPA: Fn3-like domain-containing protein [Thermoanaerobaculia bacterium]|jgi:hypothetical protein|nr:Fn3-like domain-containing protein [Thermoanaerobaculia bacterium]
MRTYILLFLLLASPAFAGEDGTLSLSPAVVMLRGDHGQSTTQTLTMVNGTSRAFSFDLVAQDVVTTDGTRTFVEAGSIAGSIAATAVFSPNRVTVPPGQTVAVTITVTLPPQTPQRAIIALFRGTNTVMSGKVPMTASLGALLTFTVSDSVELDAAPLAVRAQSATANLGVTHACRNAGREPLVAKGVMAVIDARGALVGKSPLTSKRLLPGESADFGGEYGGELDPGRYRVFVTYDYEGKTLTRDAEVVIP